VKLSKNHYKKNNNVEKVNDLKREEHQIYGNNYLNIHYQHIENAVSRLAVFFEGKEKPSKLLFLSMIFSSVQSD
jgi:hypothetical protein